MAKIKIFRYSKEPLNIEDKIKYQEEFRQLYDKVEDKAQKVFEKTTGRLTLVPRMLVVQRMLSYGERLLTAKHNFSLEIDMPKSDRAWKKLIEAYEAPILVAQRSDGKGNVLIIMDEMQG